MLLQLLTIIHSSFSNKIGCPRSVFYSSFSLIQSPVQDYVLHLVIWKTLQSFIGCGGVLSWPWHFLRVQPSYLAHVPPLMFVYFLLIRFGLCIFGRNPTEVVCPQSIISGDTRWWSVLTWAMLSCMSYIQQISPKRVFHSLLYSENLEECPK